MVESIGIHRRGLEIRRADVYADRLEALMNLAFLMRTDIDRKENLREYLQYMDVILERMARDEVARYS